MMMHERDRLVCSDEDVRQQVNLSSYSCARRSFTKTNIYNLILPFDHSGGHVTQFAVTGRADSHNISGCVIGGFKNTGVFTVHPLM